MSVKLTCLQLCLVRDTYLDLAGILSEALTFGIIDINLVKEVLIKLIGKLFAYLNQGVTFSIDRQFLQSKSRYYLDYHLILVRLDFFLV